MAQKSSSKSASKDVPFQEQALFGGEKASKSVLFAKVTPQPPQRSGFPTLLMSQGFSRNAARADAMLTLRISANQAAKMAQVPRATASQKQDFLDALDREAALKEGALEPEMAMRDALMMKFFTKGRGA